MNPTSHKVIAVCLGKATPINAKSGMSGIFKKPVTGPVEVTELGLAGDTICDTENHGGVYQAIYAYGSDDQDWWSKELGFELKPGTFGENLVIEGMPSETIHVGDRLIGPDLELQVTHPRIPCITFATRMNDKMFVRRFMKARRPGFYCRVIQPGTIEAGTSLSFAKGNQAHHLLDLFGRR